MKILKLIFLLLVTGYHSLAYSQSLVVAGRVDGASGEPLPGANVIVDNGQGTSTDVFGNFKLKLAPGVYNVTVSYIGYKTQRLEVSLVDQPLKEVNFHLVSGTVELAGITVTTEEAKNLENISSYDIRLRPTESSQDVLRVVPGLFTAQHAGGGKAEQIFLRGFDIDHGTDISLSVDGMPVNLASHAHGQGYSDLHFVIPETIEKVNFNKGPYYAAQGNFNTAGYASFQTLSDLPNDMIKLEVGQFGTLRTVAMINLLDRQKENPGESMYLASEFYMTDGYFEMDQDFSRTNIMAKYSRFFENNKMLRITASAFISEWEASGQVPLRAVKEGHIGPFGAIGDAEGGETSRTAINVQYVSQLPGDATFSQQLFLARNNFNLVSNFTYFLNDATYGDQITQTESRNIYGYNNKYESENRLGKMPLDFEAGSGIRFDDVNDIRLSNTFKRTIILDDISRGNIDELNLYAYLSETLKLTPDFSINAALRYDHFSFHYADDLVLVNKYQSEDKGILSPKLNINYKWSSRVSFFAKAGVGFHSNDTRVVVEQNGKDILPQARGIDIGGVLKPLNNMVFNIAFWVLKLDQEFVYVGDEGIVEPAGKTMRKGIDLSMRYQPLQWLYIDTDFNYTNSRTIGVRKGEHFIPLAPVLTSAGGLTVTEGGINASIRYRYLGDRSANENNSIVAEGYFLLDAVLKYRHNKLELGLSAINILNRLWKEAQFETESRLFDEENPVTEIHFTPGSPFSLRASISLYF